MVEKTQNQISDKALDNLTAIEDEIETSSQYFKPKPDKAYMISINPEEKIEPRLNEKFWKVIKPGVKKDLYSKSQM